METQDAPRCPLCNQYLQQPVERIGGFDSFTVDCRICGRYEISGTLFATKLTREPGHELLPRFIRQQNEFEGTAPRIPHNWQELIGSYDQSSLSQKAMKALRVLEKRSREPGFPAPFDPEVDYPLCDAPSKESARYMLNHLESVKLIEKHDPKHFRITFAGWERLDPISGGAVIPGRVFVAMWFAKEMDPVFDFGFRPGIEENGKRDAIRVDRQHFTEKICDKIIAELRQCQLGEAVPVHRVG